MRINITLKNLKSSESVHEKIHEKCHRIERLFKKGISAKWTSYLKEGVNYTEVDIRGPGIDLHAKANGANLFKTFETVTNKLERQAQKKTKNVKNKIHSKKANLVILDPEQAWTDYDEDYFSDVA